MLSWLTRIQARAIARRVWIESLNCPALAEEMFRDSYPRASQETVDQLTGFAYHLWQYWIETGQDEPRDYPSKREPGFEK